MYEKKERNVILAALGRTDSLKRTHNYYYYDEQHTNKYCDGILPAEPGIKYILSKEHINDIIVIGSGATYDAGDELKKMTLKEASDFYSANIEKMSEYSFFRYRLSEYMENIDVEGNDILTSISKEEQDELIRILNGFMAELAKRTGKKGLSTLFNRLQKEPELFEELTNSIQENRSVYIPWLKQYIFNKLSDAYKMRPLEQNEDISICFMPTVTNENVKEKTASSNIMNIVSMLMGKEEEKVNLFVDVQGLQNSDDFAMITVLFMINNMWSDQISIKNIISSDSESPNLVHSIRNVLTQYQLNRLLSGVDSFIRYGKVGLIKQYWEKRNIKNKRIGNMIYAMQYIDDGITLCNIEDLKYGIKELKKVFATPNEEEGTDFESKIISLMETSIRNDYGALVEEDGSEDINILELIKWAYRKKFYQQTLTIIESHIPADFVHKGVFYYANNDEEKVKMLEMLNEEYWRRPPKDRYMFRDIEHYFVKFYGRHLVNYKQGPLKVLEDYAKIRIGELTREDSRLIQAYSIVENKEKLEELLYAYYYIGNIRNKVSHSVNSDSRFGNKRDVNKDNENIEKLNEAIEYFIDQYDGIQEELAGKEYSPCLVDQKEMMDYIHSHRRENNRGNRRGGRNRNNRNQERNDRGQGDRRSGRNSGRNSGSKIYVSEMHGNITINIYCES